MNCENTFKNNGYCTINKILQSIYFREKSKLYSLMEVKTFIISTIVVHLIFFLSIFDIYLTSRVITGLKPVKPTSKPLAKRLVFISADGLRHSTFISEKPNGSFLANFTLKTACERKGVKIFISDRAQKAKHLTLKHK